MKNRNCTIYVGKTKALISIMIAFVFTYVNSRFSPAAAHMVVLYILGS